MKRAGGGKIFFVGAGPGDAGLITVRGLSLIERADVIVMDALVNPSLVRRSKARVMYVGKRGPGAPCGQCRLFSQKEINRLLVRSARSGQRVVRLKGGDPFLFGRGGEEMEAALAARIPYEIVPGVSSITAAPAYAGIPITDRRWASQLTIVTGHKALSEESSAPLINWERLSPQGTLVILMGVHQWPEISGQLGRAGFPGAIPVAAVESGTTAHQRVLRTDLARSLALFEKKKLRSPAVIVVGEAARLADTLDWVKKEKPLLGRRFVVTRAADQAGSLQIELEDLGAEVILCPTIETHARPDAPEIASLRRQLQREKKPFDHVLFLSANGVRYFAEAMSLSAAEMRRLPIVAVGPKTADAVRHLGGRVARTARTFNAKGVGKVLGNVRGRRLLIPRVADGPEDALRNLILRGALVTEVACYETRFITPPEEIRRDILSGVDAVFFTSASTVRSFAASFSVVERRSLFHRAAALSIGPSTTAVLKEMGIKNVRQSSEATVESLVDLARRRLARE